MEKIDGLDTAVGMASTGGREVLYLRLLVKYRDKAKSFSEDSLAALGTGQFAELQRAAHDLRSTSATLGALAVADESFVLEQAVANALPLAELERLVANVDKVLAPLVERLDRLHRDRAGGEVA